jgi:hypothetical protein
MRPLKRGTRGDDVLLWQQFLVQLRTDPKAKFPGLPIRLDGIFGRETARATVDFQRRFQLRTDGVVGRDTYLEARGLGFLDPRVAQGTPGSEIVGPLLGPFAAQLRAQAPPPLIARDEPSPIPPPPAGNTREQSFARLRAEAWQASATIQDALVQGHAVFQLLRNGAGDYVYDEYSVSSTPFPQGRRRRPFWRTWPPTSTGRSVTRPSTPSTCSEGAPGGKPRLGELIDIDILGPDNGSVVLVESKPNYFVSRPSTATRWGLTRRTDVASSASSVRTAESASTREG